MAEFNTGLRCRNSWCVEGNDKVEILYTPVKGEIFFGDDQLNEATAWCPKCGILYKAS